MTEIKNVNNVCIRVIKVAYDWIVLVVNNHTLVGFGFGYAIAVAGMIKKVGTYRSRTSRR